MTALMPEEFAAAVEDRQGHCHDCRRLTTPGVAPDAVGLACAACGANRVCGAAVAEAVGQVVVS